MKKIIPVVIAVIHKQDKFLLTERKGNGVDDTQFGRIWHFPGGELEYGEELHAALKREIKEELAVTIEIGDQLPHIFSPIRSHWHGLLIPYVCSLVGNEDIVLNDESFQFGWFTAGEVRNLHVLPFVTEMLDEALLFLKKG